jgi:hypothetical protein
MRGWIESTYSRPGAEIGGSHKCPAKWTPYDGERHLIVSDGVPNWFPWRKSPPAEIIDLNLQAV